MELSVEQRIAFDKYIKRENIFITGPGGSGKSELIRRIYKHAVERFRKIHVTALTGCAAILLNCNAKTVHSWAGIGLGTGTLECILTKINRNRFAVALWQKTDILVVDEVSMLSMKLFELLNAIGKVLRHNDRPFGGIQLIFSGDFFQLPPVGNREEPDTSKFCFESKWWNVAFPQGSQIQLIKIFRQKDPVYASILNQIRIGRIKKSSNEILIKNVGKPIDPNLVITKLFPTKNKVECINSTKMAEIQTPAKTFDMVFLKDIKITSTEERQIRAKFNDEAIQMELDYMAMNLNCEKSMKIKIGCQVMSIVNVKSETDDRLEICNGSQGKVVSMCPLSGFPVVKYNNGIEKVMSPNLWLSEKIPGVGVSQVPLILAWALTIHKSQGSTLDCAEVDAGSGIFECGQTYVALSRVKNLEGLYLSSFDVNKIQINPKVQDYYDALTAFHNTHFVPIPEVIATPITLLEKKEPVIEKKRELFSAFKFFESKVVCSEEEGQEEYED